MSCGGAEAQGRSHKMKQREGTSQEGSWLMGSQQVTHQSHPCPPPSPTCFHKGRGAKAARSLPASPRPERQEDTPESPDTELQVKSKKTP